MDIERVLLFRHDFLVSKKMFEKDPEWTSGAGFANWKLYGTFKTEYANARKVFLERRRHERTAAALAAAEAEIARLRAALEKASLIAAEGRYWANQSGSRHRFDEIMKLASGALFDVQTLNPDANHENG